MAYLTCLGAAICPRLRLCSALNTQPRLYTLLVGESATDRKSTCLNMTVQHFKNILTDFRVHYGLGSPEGLQRIVEEEENVTSILLINDEFKSFVDKAGIKNSTLLTTVNTLFEQNFYENVTKKSHINIQDARLSMLAATTLETYESIYDRKFIQIGFPNRVFLVTGTAEKRFSIPPRIPLADQNDMKDFLVQVLQHVGNGLELKITQEAYEFYHQWYLKLEKSVHAKRLETYSLRLMMLLAANERKNEIDLETTKDATALCDWQLETRKMHDPIDADNEIARMEERLRRCLRKNSLTERDLKRRVNYNKYGIYIYNTARNNLRGIDEIGFDKAKKRWFLK
jgi:hypothetical protein